MIIKYQHGYNEPEELDITDINLNYCDVNKCWHFCLTTHNRNYYDATHLDLIEKTASLPENW